MRNYEQEIAQEIIETTWSTKKARKALMNGTKILPKIKCKDGNDTANRDRISKEVSDFYRVLYSDDRLLGDGPYHWDELAKNRGEIPPISKQEVAKVLKKLKMGKAAGLDEIGNEALKAFWTQLAEPLAKIFNENNLSSGHAPEQWLHSEIVLIHKKGNPSVINNYRPISLSAGILKVLMTIIKDRIYNTLDLSLIHI